MPRVNLRRKLDMDADLYDWISGECRRHHINQTQLGRELGCSQQVISKKIINHDFSTYQLICIFALFDTDPETISKLLKVTK